MLGVLLACCASVTVGGDGPPPNVVVLYADDLNLDLALPAGCTPALDALAARGVRFERAYASHPHCSPSRASLLCGQRTHHTQLLLNTEPLPFGGINGVPYLPARLRDAGYFTVGTGKVFHESKPECWDAYFHHVDDPGIAQPAFPHVPGMQGMIIGGPFMNGPGGELGQMADSKSTDTALELLAEAARRREATGQPFALWVGWEATHDPFIYPQAYDSLFTLADVPPLPPGEAGDWQAAVNEESYTTPWFYDPDWGATEEERRAQAMLAYFRCIRFVDHEVGRLLHALLAFGLAEDTIVVFVGDHGWSFSEHAHLGKTTGFDEDIVTPLLIAVPDLPLTHGRRVETPVSQVDVYPTLMELLGLAAPAPLEGSSLVPLLHDAEAPHPPAFYTTEEQAGFNLTRYVVKRDAATGEIWKLGAWEHDDAIPQIHQLYNLSADPGEYENLYTDAGAVDRIAELRDELRQVGLLGPLARNFDAGSAGALGVPGLTWLGVPSPGAPGQLRIGNSSGAAKLGLLCVGFDGSPAPLPAGSPALGILPTFQYVLPIPPHGLVLAASLPAGPLFDEFPIGLQVLQLDPASATKFAKSRALSLFIAN